MRPRGPGAERGLDDAATSLRASQVFIALCAPALLLLAVAVVTLVPEILRPGTVPVVLGAGVLAQPVAALAVLQHRRTRRPQSWWSVWATLLIAVLTLCVRDPAFRQEAVMALVVGPLYAAMFTSIRSMLLHLALAGGTASSLVLAIAGDPLVRMARVLAVDMVLVITVSGFFILRRRLDAALHRAVTALERADHLAAHDPLTGLLNRRGLSAALEVAPCGAPGPDPSTTGAVLLDIDHFKRINDTLGHQTGDEVLCRVAAVLTRTVRPGDLVARVGGEEFFVVVPGADLADVAALAERLRTAVSADVDGPAVTVSAGVAATAAHASGSLDDLYGRADRLLYRAKVEGRDRVCVDAA
ncbi:GGDEF domain-containing protein [Kineococcus sp. R86509]|uniref:GGDEF domain-containing protein n=1 Tax=Kineococcus sp. R86509 TaxID=3093851 RepID=UPI0036D41F0A